MAKKNIVIALLIIIALVGFIKKDVILEKSKKILFSREQYNENTLTIVLNAPETDLSPYTINLNNLIRTANIYQGLVAFDKNLKIIPALAVSWGNTDPVTWEFKLRKDVTFHDRSKFTADNVIESFDNAKDKIETILNTIKEIKKVDDYNILIITKNPDPLFLSKLTKFFISRPGNIGTGPYKIHEWAEGVSLDLTAWQDYWGKQPVYRNAVYAVTPDRTRREMDFDEGKTDILVAVPQEKALELPKDQLKTSYSLEVNFLMFKMDDELFSQRKIREAIKTLFDPAQIEAIGNNFVRQATQFIAPGVYGYNTDIMPFKYDEGGKAKNLFGDHLEKIVLDYASSYRTLSEYISNQLKDAGFSVNNNAISTQELLDKIKNNKSRLFIAGWQAEDGDAGGFLDAFIHSDGEYNNGRYKNAEIDRMIEESRQEMDPKKRLELLQNIMQKLNDELIGIPLFESSRLYAVQKNIDWEPRLDGLVLASEVE
jgi:peptide/nickel transport system substrate-binding protein